MLTIANLQNGSEKTLGLMFAFCIFFSGPPLYWLVKLRRNCSGTEVHTGKMHRQFHLFESRWGDFFHYLIQCCVSGSGIQCLFDPWIRDPRWVKIRIRIPDEQPVSYFQFFGLKYLKYLMRIRDLGWKKFVSGMEKIRFRDPDPQHWFYTSLANDINIKEA